MPPSEPAGATTGERVVGLLDRLGFSPDTEPAVGSTVGHHGAAAHLPAARCGAPSSRGGLPGAPRAGGRRPRGAPRAVGRPAARAVRAPRGLRARPCPPHWCDERRPARRDDRGRAADPPRARVGGRHPWLPTSRRPAHWTPPRARVGGRHPWRRRHRRGAGRRHLPAVRRRQARRTAARVDRARRPSSGRCPRAGPSSSSDRRATAVDPVTWTREKPAGGGPLAGVAAGVLRVRTRLVAVVAGDMPYAGPALERLVAALRTAPPEVGGVVATDDAGFANPLLAAYRTSAVRAALPIPAANRPAKLLLEVPHLEVRGHRTGRPRRRHPRRPPRPRDPPRPHLTARHPELGAEVVAGAAA